MGDIAVIGSKNGQAILSVDSTTFQMSANGELQLIPVLPSGWIALPYVNSWVDYGAPYSGGAYYSQGSSSMVSLRGGIKSGTTGVIATLPAAYRPAQDKVFVVSSGLGALAFTTIIIGSNGVMTLQAGYSNTFVSLEGITYDAL